MMYDRAQYPTPRFEFRWDKPPQVPDWMKATWSFLTRPWRFIAIEFDVPFTNVSFAALWEPWPACWQMAEVSPGCWEIHLGKYLAWVQVKSRDDIAGRLALGLCDQHVEESGE